MKERYASIYTLRSLTPDRPPPAENIDIIVEYATIMLVLKVLMAFPCSCLCKKLSVQEVVFARNVSGKKWTNSICESDVIYKACFAAIAIWFWKHQESGNALYYTSARLIVEAGAWRLQAAATVAAPIL